MRAFAKSTIFAAAALVGFSAPSVSIGETLTVVSWGGAYSKSQRKAYYEPFMKETGNVVLEDEWSGDISQVRAMVETGNYKWDVLDTYPHDAVIGCEDGILERIDPKKLGLTKDDFVPGGLLECAVGTIVWSTIFAYRSDVFPTDPPKNWADFWNLKKYAGKRSLYKQPTSNLEAALFADGVPADKIYATLRAPGGVDRAFAKLDEVKADTIWWETGAQPPQLLADKEVSMASAWNGRIYGAIVEDNQPFVIVWDGQTYSFGYWTAPANSPNRDLIYEFLAFASRKDRQGDQTNYISYGNVRKDTSQYINPNILPHLPTAPANLENALIVDVQYWADNEQELVSRFNTWIAK